MAEQVKELLCSFETDAKIVQRKKVYVVYVKEGSQIVDILNIMEAHVSLMELENVRILKEMRNTVNRKVNCETANINKTVSAAVKQVEDIISENDTIRFESCRGLEKVHLPIFHIPGVTKRTGRAFIASGGQIGGESQTQEIE